MIKKHLAHQNDLITVVIYESSVDEDIEESDFNDRPCLSFPLRAGFGYQTTGFNRFIDSNSFLLESQANEFSYTKYRDLGSDLTACFQFADQQAFVQAFARYRAADVFRRTPGLNYMIHRFMRELDSDRMALDSLVDQMLFEEVFDESLQRFAPTPDNRHCLPLIDAAKDYMHSHFSSDIGVDKIAEVSCMSRFHFTRSFKKRTGMSPYQYLKQVRFFNAKESLKKDVDVTEVAFKSGFNSLENFSAAFKKEYGVSPRAFRASFRKSYASG